MKQKAEKIPVLTCRFVEGSEVFRDCSFAWNLFVNSEPECSWGDNNRTLVMPDVIINALEGADVDDDEEVQKEVDAVVDRLKTLDYMYIDLEN
jgi:hypothetical protein